MPTLVYLIISLINFNAFAHKCRIVRHGDQTTADCTRLKLNDVPTGLPLSISGLDLSYNQISMIKNNAFESFSNLTTLTMDFNNIDIIDGYAFQGLKKLRWLSMKHNQLSICSTIFDIVLKPLLRLQHLDIRYNINKTLDISKPMLYPYFGNHFFLTNLYMDIVQNPVFNLSGFEKLSNINTIKFAKCYLKQMSNDTLIDLPSTITSIYFHDCFGSISIVEADFLKPFPLLQILNMDRVALQLGDALQVLYPFKNKRMISIIFKDIRPQVPKPVFISRVMINYLMHICVKTLVLAESEIVGYETSSLLALKSPECLENIVLSGNRFSIALGPHLRELMIFMKKIINLKFFDLSYNAINFNNTEYCNLDVLDNPSYAKEIYRKGCQIKSATTNENTNYNPILKKNQMIDESKFTIYLPANLTFLRRDWMDEKSSVGIFYLSIEGNSLKCSCDTSDFIRWLFSTKVVFDRVNKNFSCTLTNGSDSNTVVVYRRFHEHFGNCNSKKWLRLGIGLLVAFVIFTVPFAVVLYFRWKIIFWIYRNFKRVVEHRLEREFNYDIYLSYADDMLQWVQNDFLQRIETLWHMKVCVEDRDFQIGVAKADEIANAIAGSKHAVFILSESYKDNEWNKFEIERVKFENCRNYLQKIIIIVKEARVNCVPLELDDILQNVTIINWADNETGWDKLRMSLFTDSF